MNGLVFPPQFIFLSFLFFFFSLFLDLGRGTLTFDEFCRVAVHFSDEDDEALQLSITLPGMVKGTCLVFFLRWTKNSNLKALFITLLICQSSSLHFKKWFSYVME